jgi:CheY-like chemotaxis protein
MTDALLLRDLGPDEREMTQTIRASGGVLLALLDDLLDLSKLEAGRLELMETPVSLTTLADELRGLWGPLARQKQLEFSVKLAPALPPALKLDGRRLRQVLGNLISNALKFTEAGSVEVTLSRGGGKLCCSVQDTGIGISVEQQRRLFARFVQADEARARRYQGSGLGLALSRELATHMGGALEVESAPGQGSRFTCTLPLVAAPPPETAPSTVRELPPGLRVLVVDDNAVNRLVAQRLLDRSGCQVEVAIDGQGALEALGRGHFDVVLMDVHMPELDGLEATRRIRAANFPGLRIIGVSASAESADVHSCREAGMDDFLAKPITRDRLVDTLLRHTTRSTS